MRNLTQNLLSRMGHNYDIIMIYKVLKDINRGQDPIVKEVQTAHTFMFFFKFSLLSVKEVFAFDKEHPYTQLPSGNIIFIILSLSSLIYGISIFLVEYHATPDRKLLSNLINR